MAFDSVRGTIYDGRSWRACAACADVPSDVFFPVGETGEALVQIARAKAVCARCPVRESCLDFALRTNQQYGIWGGTDEDQRRRIRRRWRRSGTSRPDVA